MIFLAGWIHNLEPKMPQTNEGEPNKAQLSDQEREYLTMMYEEHAEHARLHETLRAAVTGLMIALIAGILTFASAEKVNKQACGAAVCVVSILGAILNIKHDERYELHIAVLKGYRSKLETGIDKSLIEINTVCRKEHRYNYSIISRMRLRYLWLAIYLITCVTGVWLYLYTPILQQTTGH